ncbi:hypothetical protein llap_6615 [Limosa lapponica baueri]|uniref:Uncharacterized protein n=1 Tax=Limosa lapponica baueri TaxID=1758121 RepID=A0A2I0UAN8_LIMLA|nr:hypothetical protein llap_6615 [Limosa lapponica baueri]
MPGEALIPVTVWSQKPDVAVNAGAITQYPLLAADGLGKTGILQLSLWLTHPKRSVISQLLMLFFSSVINNWQYKNRKPESA